MSNSVDHPSHYNQYPVEVIDMMIHIFGMEKVIDFCYINAFKYRMRAGLKGDATEDLAKEQWYLEMAFTLKGALREQGPAGYVSQDFIKTINQ